VSIHVHFGGELARQSRGIDQITEQDGELAAFGVCAQRDGVGMRKAAWTPLYRRWVTKESRKS
jgi:hypothetical protein